MNPILVDIELYRCREGAAIIKGTVDLKNSTLWTTQESMAEFFEKDVGTISKHLNNIFKSEELIKSEVTFDPNDYQDGEKIIINPNSKKQPILYNLDAIISVGFHVKSNKAIQFRKWAIKIIRDYIIKGFSLDVEALKNNASLGSNHFQELVENVLEITESK